MRNFVVGDIHGNLLGLKQVLKKADFGKEDCLISLGDICDGYPDVKETIEYLIKIKADLILGNHDQWALEWMETGFTPDYWVNQGGRATLFSYGQNVPSAHLNYLKNAPLYRIDTENRLYVHGGFDPSKKMEEQKPDVLLWDRDLIETAVRNKGHKRDDFQWGGFKEVFIGHTTTEAYGSETPIHAQNLWCMDTGAGWGGKLSMMDIDSKEIFQSDYAIKLYPKHQPRR